MGFLLLLLLYTGLIFNATVFCANKDTKNNFKGTIHSCLLSNIIPIHYNIIITSFAKERNFSLYVESSIEIQICHSILDIVLYSPNIHINEITLIDNNGWNYTSKFYTYDNKMFNTIFKFKNKILPGFYELQLKYLKDYTAQYYIKDLYTDEEGYTAWLPMNLFASIAIRGQFMCFGYPVQLLKPTINISLKHQPNYKVLSNMPIREEKSANDGMIWTHFDTTPPMSICNAIVAFLSNFDRVHNANENVNMWCRPNFTSQVQFAQNVAEKVAQHMVQYTNISEKIPKTDYIAIPNFPFSSFSNWGFIVYNEENIIYDLDIHSVTQKRHVAKITAYEMIQQWFGNLVTPFQLVDIWLNKGFASFLQAYILNKIFENWRTMDFLVIENLHGFLRDTDSRIKPPKLKIYKPKNNDIHTIFPFYNKASVILRMLQHIITEEVFQKGVRIYLSTHQFKTASSKDLWAAMQIALNKSDVPHRDFKIKEVMHRWINEAHYPLVTVIRNYKTGKIMISQENFLGKDKNNFAKWWIPVTFTTQTHPDFTNIALNFHWLRPKDRTISFKVPSDAWVIVNLQQIGYYRVNYDDTNWLKIANYLNSEEYKKIHVLNRAQLIDDAFNLWYYAKLKPKLLLYILSYLSRETDYVAWYPMFQILFKLQKFFELPESEIFKLNMTGNFNALLENVGYEDLSNEDSITRLKRLNATYWACTVGNKLCLEMANTKLLKHLTYLNKPLLSPYWYHWTYCFGLKTADIHTWGRVWQLYLEIREQKLLECLACSKDPYIISKYLNFILSSSSTLQETEKKIAFRNIIMKHAQNDDILDIILNNFMTLKPKLISTCDELREIISNVYSHNQLSKIKSFIETSKVTCIENITQIKETLSYIEDFINEYSRIESKLQIQKDK